MSYFHCNAASLRPTLMSRTNSLALVFDCLLFIFHQCRRTLHLDLLGKTICYQITPSTARNVRYFITPSANGAIKIGIAVKHSVQTVSQKGAKRRLTLSQGLLS